MKGTLSLKLLPACIAALTCSQAFAELTPIQDTELGTVSGQSGISINLETRVTMDEFRYTDEGSISLKDVTFGGADKTAFFEGQYAGGRVLPITQSNMLDDVKIDVDVRSDGDLLISVGALCNTPGCVGTIPVDFGLSVGSVDLVSADGLTSTSVLENFNMTGYFTAAFFQIENDGANGEINAKVSFAIDDIDFDAPLLGMGIRDMYIAGAGFNEDLEFGAFDIANSGAVARLNIRTAQGNVGGAQEVDNALQISLAGNSGDAFVADVGIGAVIIGGTSIGSFTIDDLALSNTTLKIYGH
ncbi:DUF6160 family protein [Litoribrevibacter albus]|uniref:DUF6160 domain-containing protein n=1 Tax=Litoribrevibacter albus TaxID=1473156 RepID=A0AA37SA94_9GAMM|nr:DUF6160 family protein [Litoribrevibacter albus]GLQ31022.1 hypothetical protein GCM10007876_15010 [Litoribrevibacter albus]